MGYSRIIVTMTSRLVLNLQNLMKPVDEETLFSTHFSVDPGLSPSYGVDGNENMADKLYVKVEAAQWQYRPNETSPYRHTTRSLGACPRA